MSNKLKFLGLMVTGVIVWRMIGGVRGPRVIFCDVGQGDGAIVINGREELVIDTGPDNKAMVRCLNKHLPYGDREIEGLILSHSDSDHSGGLLDIKKYYNVQNIYSSNLAIGDIVRLGMIDFEVISTGVGVSGEGNEASVVGVLNYGGKNILMTGDATAEMEKKIVWRKLLTKKIDILKVSHHGAETATSEELLKALNVEKAIISVGKKNKFGHPRKEILERLKKYGVEILRTDEMGDVVINF